MRIPIPRRLVATSICLVFFGHDIAADKPQIDFARQILPILSDKCFVCHGPDTRDETDLRLDSFEQATADRGGYRAIDPASLEDSELLKRIHSTDDPMPPADSEKQLTSEDSKLLEQWVRQGGNYAKHWAFVVPQKTLPEGVDGIAKDFIDAFVGARLSAAGSSFAKEADRATLARRVALVLTGLPPEPDQLDRFMADESNGAYERLVDELLSSSRFGEHQARYWLDAVRYGDTHGLHLDNRRGIYPYRDWVVRAMNNNLPLDDFIRQQLAGDLMPNPTLDQRIATGYVRMNPSTGEGGAIADEFQAKNNFDRVETFGTVFLGMSLTCARCHTHKYDPIPQTEYYQLMAFFNNTAEPPLDGNSYTYGPTVRTPADQAAWSRWQKLSKEGSDLLTQFEAKLGAAEISDSIEYSVARAKWKTSDWKISGPIAAEGSFADAKFKPATGLPGAISGRAARGLIPGPEQVTWLTAEVDVPEDQTLWITFSGAIGTQILNAETGETLAAKDTADRTAVFAIRFAKGKHRLKIRLLGADGMTEIEVRVQNPWDQIAKGNSWQAASTRERLLMCTDPEGPISTLSLQESAVQLAKDLAAADANFTTTLVAQELAKSRETRVLSRGEYDSPKGDPVQPGILNVMSPFPEGAPRNRLGLADWLTAREHPLVARVLINRIWQRAFGEGLVRTPEDFGLQGQQPTHPALLDWLAVELQDSGWDLKHMLRLMVTSKTFRQSSAWRSDVDDPENRFLARGPSYRLDAEVLRDVALWASQLLDPAMGGEGVKPYQPSGMWIALAHPASNTKNYQRDSGKRLYRRSLYVYWKRTSPHPMMTLFDAPDRESSCVRRSRTSTALQSLGMLNETQRIEMARGLAERLIRESTSDPNRLDLLFKLVTCKLPSKTQRKACANLLEQYCRRYTESKEDALRLLATGEAVRDETIDPIEHAAWTQVAITVLASDAAILLY